MLVHYLVRETARLALKRLKHKNAKTLRTPCTSDESELDVGVLAHLEKSKRNENSAEKLGNVAQKAAGWRKR